MRGLKIRTPEFPGLYCPGLIEAATRPSQEVHRRRFRGSIAPASLKLRKPEAMPRLGELFPGLYCPGLIEANPVARGKPAVTVRFRGSIAPASLKQRLAHADDDALVRFRGSIAPASLKRPCVHAL